MDFFSLSGGHSCRKKSVPSTGFDFILQSVYEDDYWDEERPRKTDLKALAAAKLAELKAEGSDVHPVTANGRNLAKKFWGKAWMRSLAELELYYNTLSQGRTYLRKGCVLDVRVSPGQIEALVMGEYLYHVHIEATPPDEDRVADLRERCAGQIGSWIDLLKGEVSDDLMSILSNPNSGLFPRPDEWNFSCACAAWADMCEHVAAVLYAFGVLLDDQPELLFTLRNMKAGDFIPAAPVPTADGEDTLKADDGKLSDIFGIELG